MLSKEKAMDGVHLFVFDMDGTVYLGDQPIEGSIEFIREVEAAKDRDYIFFTYNASKVPAVYVEKLRKMGLEVPLDKVATGVRNGAKGFLVLTGEATMKTVEESDVEPTCIYESLDEMRKYL